MAPWTRDRLIEHRRSMGWPPLGDDGIDRILAILNDALGPLEALDDVSGVLPDVRSPPEPRDG